MGGQGIKEGISVELVVALNADLQDTIAHWAGNAKDYIAIADLAIIQCHLSPLIDLAADKLGSTGNASAIFAAIGKVDTLIAQALQERPAAINPKDCATTIRDGNVVDGYSHISLVQSPPG